MTRITKSMLDRVGKSVAQDWAMASERLKRDARDRQDATFGEIVVYESPPSPVGLVARAFTGVMTWRAEEKTAQTRFIATAFGGGFADRMSEDDFEQLRRSACKDLPGIPYEPARN